MKVFAGTSNPALAEQIATYLKTSLGEVDINRFPDGEIFVKIKENIRGRDCYVVQSICNPPNENLMELLILIDAMRRASAKRITAVLPFYGYGRQDRKDQPRVPITAKLVANLLVAAGTNRLLTMDLHAQQIQGFFDIPVDHLYASPIIVKHLKDQHYKNPIIVSPDTGAVKACYAYSQMLGCGLAIVAKQRKGHSEVEVLSLVGEVEGCTAIMVDDLTTTAGTLCSAADVLKKHGALAVHAVVSHAAMVPKAFERLKQSQLNELVVTGTIPL
ncbi:MAG: ribose-phosphate pyrophosphokinase, partial [Verrucomicrobia bacterium]|nr:ribose-phosphate pyrophosphokinase [Verrucomicrobiota bacterium]